MLGITLAIGWRGLPVPESAQKAGMQQDSAISALLGRASDWLRSGRAGNLSSAASTLRQSAGANALRRADSLAEGIARLIVESDTAYTVRARALRLMAELQVAGLSSGEGVPYGRSMEMLMEIAANARDPRTRIVALRAIPEQPDRKRGLDFVRAIAVDRAPADNSLLPSIALSIITGYASIGDATALRIARELWDRNLVLDERARYELEGFATIRGWKRSSS
jgi:hypothetical protein